GGSAHDAATAADEAGLGKVQSDFARNMLNDQYGRSANLEESRLGRASGAYEGERGRMQGAIPLRQAEQGLTLDRARALTGVGDVDRSLQQDYLNQAYNDWQEQQNNPYKMLDYFTGLLGRAQGGVSPNMTQTSAGYGASPFSQILGLGLLG